MDQKLINIFLDKKNVYAVVGASRDPAKYGHQIYQDLRDGGYRVYPINPNAKTILGDKCYPSLNNLPVKPDVVDVVVPPKIALKTAAECVKQKIDKILLFIS